MENKRREVKDMFKKYWKESKVKRSKVKKKHYKSRTIANEWNKLSACFKTLHKIVILKSF